MKRDMKLIHKILKYVEKEADGVLMDAPDWNKYGYSAEQVHYHIGLCWQAGFIDASKEVTSDPYRYLIRNLTWIGHERLQSLSDGNG